MRISVSNASPLRAKVDSHVFAVWSEDIRGRKIASDDLAKIDRDTRGALSAAFARQRFSGKASDQLIATGPGGREVIFLGAGKRRDAKARTWLTLAARAAKAVQGVRGKSLTLSPRAELDETLTRLLAEGAHLGAYHYDEMRGKGTKAKDKPARLAAVTLCASGADIRALTAAVKKGEVIGEALALARDLINGPGNVITPTALAARAKAWCEAGGLQVEVLDKRKLEKMGCGGILAVNRGSAEPPCMIVMRYRPRGAVKGASLALVGKGVTFDTGGISLKPGAKMHLMKADMSGAAAVIAAMGAIGRLGLPINVTGIVPATDNMPDGNAIKPGDVITHLNGKTVEVLNTDAEGRLILADALVHACREFKPTHMLDFATLTGSCVIALGERMAGVMGNDDEFRTRICALGEEAGEDLWPLPLNEDFTAAMKSDVADLANISSEHGAGAEQGGAFLQEFVDGPKWCHLDIAGPFFASTPFGPYRCKGGTGFGVLTALQTAEALAE
ncbi:leucyl aminopeptidase [Candidatus Sumerlaeota bacterium]|nr:leucyl aminopeptidase [Candidatus Sumerlaeota bacterium]